MAELLQLDKAATLVGKSEVTLRRLIKAGKIPYEKEKTLTGFVYRVDPDAVRAYYQSREGTIFSAEDIPVRTKEEAAEAREVRSVRVPVAGESGEPWEYWLKKSERYEEKYNQEVINHSQTREQLGVWRGRAEQAQGMVVKLLPAAGEVNVQSESKETATEKNGRLVGILLGLIVLIVIAAGGAIAYLMLAAR